MPASIWQVGRNRDFRGGETQADLPEEVGRNQLLRMENAMIFPGGRLTAAHQVDTETITNAELGVAIILGADGTYTAYAAPGNGILYSQFLDTSSVNPADMASGTETEIAGARIVGVHKSVKFLGKEYCPNPNSDDTKDGILNLTDLELINIPGSSATASKLRLYTNRLWLIYSDGTMRHSDNGSATVWNALNVLLLPNSEPIIDFHPVQGGAIIYSATAIYAMYGSNYTDISFVPLILNKQFTTGSIETAGIVFILSTEGVYRAALNGAELLPHHQEVFFSDHFHIFSDPAKVVTAIHMQDLNAIIFTWREVYHVGGQSLVFYLANGAMSKLNRLLPTAFPYAMALNDSNTDYLWGVSAGVFAKSAYPSPQMTAPQVAIIQTRHEDCDSFRDKVWSELVIVVDEAAVYGVTVQAVLDESDTPITVASEIACVKGDNTIWLDDLPRSKTISILITINNTASLTIVSDDDSSMILTDDDTGDELVATVNPGNWTIKELRLRYREAGPAL